MQLGETCGGSVGRQRTGERRQQRVPRRLLVGRATEPLKRKGSAHHGFFPELSIVAPCQVVVELCKGAPRIIQAIEIQAPEREEREPRLGGAGVPSLEGHVLARCPGRVALTTCVVGLRK